MANQDNIITTIDDCELITLEQHHSNRQGNLSVVDNRQFCPFDIQRVFYIYDIPGGESRGAHAHRSCHQFIIAASGAFEVALDDGNNKKIIQLNKSFIGLHIPPGIWASEQNFSSGAICLVLTSHLYNEGDYIRDYDDYIKYKNGTIKIQ